MDQTDRHLLDILQSEFPLVCNPFIELGNAVGLLEDEVIARVQKLTDDGIIRQIGPIYSSKHLGYHSTLAAFAVNSSRIQAIADEISLHTGVSHNYFRNHEYNLWFTLTLPKEKDLKREVTSIAQKLDVDDFLCLPAIQTFRLGVHFRLSDSSQRVSKKKQINFKINKLTDFERDVVRITQGHLPLVSKPFASAAEFLGITETHLVEILSDFNRRGVMRRFAAVVRHRKVGFDANGMVCWVVPEQCMIDAGKAAANFQSVSHCYERPPYPPRWPYNFFTMIHGKTKMEVEKEIIKIKKIINSEAHIVLYSEKEFKKERVRYFLDKE